MSRLERRGPGSPFEETPGRIDVALAIPVREGRFLVARRQGGLHRAGYWEFPGGKVEAGEQPAEAAERELLEEVGLVATAIEPLTIVVHDYAEQPLRFHVFLATTPEGEPRMDTRREWGWKSFAELQQLEMPEANRQMIRAVRWRL